MEKRPFEDTAPPVQVLTIALFSALKPQGQLPSGAAQTWSKRDPELIPWGGGTAGKAPGLAQQFHLCMRGCTDPQAGATPIPQHHRALPGLSQAPREQGQRLKDQLKWI